MKVECPRFKYPFRPKNRLSRFPEIAVRSKWQKKDFYKRNSEINKLQVYGFFNEILIDFF